MSSALRADLVDTEAALAGLVPDWWSLWHRCPGATPFTSPAWLVPWWSAFRPGALRMVAVRRDGRLVALAPLYLEDSALGRRLLPLGIGISDRFDLLLDPADADAPRLIAEAWRDLAGWQAIELEELPDGSRAASVPAPAGATEEWLRQNVRPVLDLAGADGDAMRCLPARKRRKLRMARHRVERRDGVAEPVPAEEVGPFLDKLVRLHGLRWAERGQPGVLADERVRAFHASALPALAEAGLADLWRLAIEGRTAGAYYGLRDGSGSYAYLGGIDPDFAFESPGNVLIGAALDAAVSRGATSFDFLRGQEPYKYEWGARDSPNHHRRFRREPPGG